MGSGVARKTLLTAIGSCHPDTGDEGNDTGDEDGTTTSEVLVKRRIGPATDETRAEIRGSIKQTSKPDLVRSDVEFLKVESLFNRQYYKTMAWKQ